MTKRGKEQKRRQRSIIEEVVTPVPLEEKIRNQTGETVWAQSAPKKRQRHH
ncbi:hypothetical protein F511_38442 [Dorcoceras hygrometricum]|uniref:Uncharacterized protein n=1 Tax=Dorcoceras hygrometricum TaxID=472368 RepID=A0A2Z7D211_9LAMI|nr:hypothetical protein F511_38442 [Dorcoceras hygrometricum]